MKTLIRETRSVELHMYEDVKYETYAKLDKVINYEAGRISSFEVLSGEKAMEFEKEIDESSFDEYHEYLILYFADSDDVASFRNSHVDMFIM